MSRSAVGSLVDEHGAPWKKLSVELTDASALFSASLDTGETTAQGRFALSYGDDSLAPGFGPRRLEFTVRDQVRRVLHRIERDDIAGDRLDFGTLTLRRADVEGFLVTLGTGQARFVSQGNAVRLLMDKDAFEHAVDLFAGAHSSLLISQLYFPLPEKFAADATTESPEVIFEFVGDGPTVAALPRKCGRGVGAGDHRPERRLIEAADRGVDVRLLLNGYRLPMVVRLLIGAAVFCLLGPAGALGVDAVISDKECDADEAKRYFGQSGRSRIRARKFAQPIASSGVMHAKLMVADGQRALSIGSPFGQSYVDLPSHAIDEPRRGGSTGLPKHDAGFSVDGPAVAAFHETLALLWNEDEHSDPVPATIPPPGTQGIVGDAITALQLVRTLSANRLTGFGDGEKGILEAYQRGIANARQFVYLETQYFTNDAIGDALVGAMRANPALQVIVLLNIAPDVPTYPFKQRRLITRIRTAVGMDRFGVFTRWSHQPGDVRGKLLPIYVHAKAAVIDDTWATIGSANLDGLSLDSSLLGDVLHKLFGAQEQRAIEVNGVMLNGVDGQPPTTIVDLLRRRLWAEHLGYARADGKLDENHADLASAGANAVDWLGLWRRRAQLFRDKLVNDPSRAMSDVGHVLAWPEDDETYPTPRKHLNALAIPTFPAAPGEADRSHAIHPLRAPRPFDFKDGNFKPGHTAVLDYP